MNRSFQALGALALISVLIGCGKSPLTDEQRTQFKELTFSTNSVVKSAESAKKAKAGGTALAVAPSSELEKRISEAQCDFGTPDLSSGDLSKLSSINMTVGGASCPISMDIGIKMSGGNSAEFNMKFEIKDKDLAELSDVTKADLHGVISGSDSSASGVIEGTITSKKYGSVGVKMTMNFSASGGSIEVAYTFPTFTAIVEVSVSENGATYKLNGSDISQQEFTEFGAAPGMSTPTATSTNESSSSFSYNLTYNGCSTEKQSFSSKEAMCEGLKNDSLNHNCAEELRRTKFQSDGCSGTFN